ncbi:MAG: tetratricopeptide repeat protein [Xanthomonadales bacterium]|nr:tetratricopeptide repeat protein [Xanthomonadales bacterium]
MFVRAIVSSVALFALLGCAAGPVADDPPEDVVAEVPQTPAEETLAHIDPDVIYYVGAAEILGQREQYRESAHYYRKAAELSADPEVAARAVKVAAFVDDEALTLAGVERWIELDPDDAEPHRYAAILFLRKGDAERAWTHVQPLIGDGSDPARWQAVGKMLDNAPDRGAAAAILQRLVEVHDMPISPALYEQFGDLAVKLGEIEVAEALASRQIQLNPEQAELYHWRGRLRHSLGRVDAAAEDLKRATELAPEDQQIRQSYAALLAEEGEYAAALAQLEQVEPTAVNLYSKALYAEAAEDRERAIELLEELVAFPAEDGAQKYYLLGQLAELLELPTERILEFYGNVQDGKNLDDAKLRSAIVLARAGERDRARFMLQKLQNGNAATAGRAFLAEAAVLRDADEPEAALSVYGRGIELLPENVDLLFARALHAESMDLVDLAEQDLRRVLELRPDDPNALNALGYTLADRTDRFEEALDLIEQAYAQLPEEPAIVDSLGWVHFKLGNLDLALEYLRAALDLQFDPEIAAHLGEVLWAMGREEEARSIWADALERDPEAEPVLSTRERLLAE